MKPRQSAISGYIHVMMAMTFLGLLLAATAGPASGFFGGGAEPGDLTATVAVVTEANYDEVVEGSRLKPWILEFYAPWCKHCQVGPPPPPPPPPRAAC